MTKCSGATWRVLVKDRDFITRLFQKTGCLITIDGSDDDMIKPQGLYILTVTQLILYQSIVIIPIYCVIYCITCTLCKKIYIGETGRRLADRFREHLRDAEQNNTDASKPVARHFNLPNHSHHNMTICGLYLHHGNTESRKNLEQKLIFQLGTLSPHGINERLSFH